MSEELSKSCRRELDEVVTEHALDDLVKIEPASGSHVNVTYDGHTTTMTIDPASSVRDQVESTIAHLKDERQRD